MYMYVLLFPSIRCFDAWVSIFIDFLTADKLEHCYLGSVVSPPLDIGHLTFTAQVILFTPNLVNTLYLQVHTIDVSRSLPSLPTHMNGSIHLDDCCVCLSPLQIVHENKVLKRSRQSIKKLSSDTKLAEVSFGDGNGGLSACMHSA